MDDGWSCGSTDVGDVSCIMPAVQPYCSGAMGTGHGDDYYITRPEEGVIQAAATQAACVCALLENDAAKARYVKENANPPYASAKEFLAAIDAVALDGEAICYDEDGTAASVRWTKKAPAAEDKAE